MLIKVGLENNYEGKSIAWVLDHPGCFAYGKDASEAIIKVPQVLIAYKKWIENHTDQSWLADLGDFDVRLVDVFEWYAVNPEFDPDPKGVSVNAWFKHDWKSLTTEQVERGVQMLAWARADLLDLITTLTPKQLDQTFEGERWSIRGILRHISNAEFWYLDRLGLAGGVRADLPEDVFDRMAQTRQRTIEVLPTFAGSTTVLGVEGEFWSPRKILRRAAWHEKDHIQHILRLMTLL
jgi:uncharacterized damage-inducible protein DinB